MVVNKVELTRMLLEVSSWVSSNLWGVDRYLMYD